MNANITANLYDGHFDVGFDCPGATRCKWACCELMPPTEDMKCHFNDYACKHPAAQLDALERLQRNLAGKKKELNDELDSLDG